MSSEAGRDVCRLAVLSVDRHDDLSVPHDAVYPVVQTTC